MSTRELIDAIQSGDSIAFQNAFGNAMASRIVERLDAMRQTVAKNMFSEAAGAAQVGANHIHVVQVGNKYKVHAVGKNFAHGIDVGEHLSDTDLDDFVEMGGRIKHVKPTNEAHELDEEQLDEISGDTVRRYAARAQDDRADLKDQRREIKRDIKTDPDNAEFHKDTLDRTDQYIKRRESGIKRAKARMAKEEFALEDFSLEELQDFIVSEDFEQLDELSRDTLKSYVKKATGNIHQQGRR